MSTLLYDFKEGWGSKFPKFFLRGLHTTLYAILVDKLKEDFLSPTLEFFSHIENAVIIQDLTQNVDKVDC